MQRLSARPHHVGSPYDKDNAEWILARFRSGAGSAEIETSTCSSRRRRSACVEMVAPTPVPGRRSRSRRLPATPHRRRSDEQLATYNAYSNRRRRHGAAGVRELRPAGGLRGTRPPRHLGQGRDRHRAVRRLVARHQAEGRRRARRDRLPDLLGSRATMATSMRRCFPDGPMRNKDGVQRGSVDGHAARIPAIR